MIIAGICSQYAGYRKAISDLEATLEAVHANYAKQSKQVGALKQENNDLMEKRVISLLAIGSAAISKDDKNVLKLVLDILCPIVSSDRSYADGLRGVLNVWESFLTYITKRTFIEARCAKKLRDFHLDSSLHQRLLMCEDLQCALDTLSTAPGWCSNSAV